MWIALKSWYLWYSEQLMNLYFHYQRSCELLSKVDIFDIRNNAALSIASAKLVVNCSQKLISLIFGTTFYVRRVGHFWLWIALKSWYLWYSEQRPVIGNMLRICCELLSKVDIFDIRNNPLLQINRLNCVVNCSQKLISLIFGTTRKRSISKSVVNCSQKLISLIFGTTLERFSVFQR